MVVSDASPLINLAAIGHLDLLRALYGTVCIPNAVHREVTRFEEQPGADAVQSLEWVKAQSCPRPDLATALSEDLDAGEAEAIALAVESDSPLLIMDEQHGRTRADHFEIPCIGVIGVFIEAKDNEHIQAVRPYLDALQEDAGFHIDDQLYRRVLGDEGEL